MDTADILAERGSRYGNYLEQTTISQGLSNILLNALDARAVLLLPDQMDALQMICVKLSRIVNGDPNYADNWRDIAGYATLVAERLEGKTR